MRDVANIPFSWLRVLWKWLSRVRQQRHDLQPPYLFEFQRQHPLEQQLFSAFFLHGDRQQSLGKEKQDNENKNVSRNMKFNKQFKGLHLNNEEKKKVIESYLRCDKRHCYQGARESMPRVHGHSPSLVDTLTIPKCCDWTDAVVAQGKTMEQLARQDGVRTMKERGHKYIVSIQHGSSLITKQAFTVRASPAVAARHEIHHKPHLCLTSDPQSSSASHLLSINLKLWRCKNRTPACRLPDQG